MAIPGPGTHALGGQLGRLIDGTQLQTSRGLVLWVQSALQRGSNRHKKGAEDFSPAPSSLVLMT
jgi:hypothetical protein